jgi:hypothetical protein
MLGPCLNEIRAGLPCVPDDQLALRLTDQSFPGGAAMSYFFCDQSICHDQCTPFCAPGTSGGSDGGGTGGATAGTTTGTTGSTTGTTGSATGTTGTTTGVTTGTTGSVLGGVDGNCITAPDEIATNMQCRSCEDADCPPIPRCSSFGTQAPLCDTVLACVRRTNCAAISPNDCLCGNAEVGACAAGQPSALIGPCVDEIRAAFPGVPDSSLLGSLTDVSFPGGSAMFESLCDQAICPDVCIPYCPPGKTPIP